jgi:hypothetical protein
MGCCGGEKDRGHPKAVIVSGSDLKDCVGTYRRTYCIHREVSSATTRPVYKLEGKNRYIYWNPSPSGWRIGGYNNLAGHTNGNFWFKSGKDTPNPADSKVSWTFHDDPTITVKVDRPPTATENSMFQIVFGFLAARAESAAQSAAAQSAAPRPS